MTPAGPLFGGGIVGRAPLRAMLVAGIIGSWMAGLEIHGLGLALVYLAPALLLLALLASGRYPAADALARLRRGDGRPRPRPAGIAEAKPARWMRRLGPRGGGALLSAGLGGRAPPVALSVAT